VTIDTSGEWWVGDRPEDLEEYLKALSVEGYPVDAFRLSVCRCGENRFHVHADRGEGACQRVCTACSEKHFICDSEEYWAGEEVTNFECNVCKSTTANVGVGFSLYDMVGMDVRWLSVGVRCEKCGVLGCIVDWKVALSGTRHLLDEA
jgi:hypothetical protein